MSEPTAPSTDLLTQLTQMMLQYAPKSPLEMRSMLDGFAPFMNTGLPEVGAFHEAVPVCEGVSADVVVPRGTGPHPVLVYLHGGGWVCGSPKTHRKLGYRFAEAGFLVINVDYRRAREQDQQGHSGKRIEELVPKRDVQSKSGGERLPDQHERQDNEGRWLEALGAPAGTGKPDGRVSVAAAKSPADGADHDNVDREQHERDEAP
jgi:dienelactone hydrolase